MKIPKNTPEAQELWRNFQKKHDASWIGLDEKSKSTTHKERPKTNTSLKKTIEIRIKRRKRDKNNAPLSEDRKNEINEKLTSFKTANPKTTESFKSSLNIWLKRGKRDKINTPLSKYKKNKINEKLSGLKQKNPKITGDYEQLVDNWNSKRSKDTLIKVNPNGNHAEEFTYLVNVNEKNNKVQRSLNRNKTNKLLTAIESGLWGNVIFKDPTLPQLALSLFSAEKISRQQLTTILERDQLRKDWEKKSLDYFPILDESGNFTQKAKELLVPSIIGKPRFFERLEPYLRYIPILGLFLDDNNDTKPNHFLKPLSREDLEAFKLMIGTLPPSERFFYTTERQPKINSSWIGSNYVSLQSTLEDTLITLDDIYVIPDATANTKQKLVHVTCGARDALGLVRFGLDNYVPPVARFGRQTREDIENGVRHHMRNTAMSYPETVSYNKENLHEYKKTKNYEATYHDFYHSMVMSTQPPDIRAIFFHLVDIARTNHPEIKWSKEIWEWIDAEFMYNYVNHKKFSDQKMGEKEVSELFCKTLLNLDGLYGIGGYLAKNNTDFFYKKVIIPSEWDLTVQGALIYLDMVANNGNWTKLKINPQFFLEPFKSHFEAVQSINSEPLGNNKELNLLKCLLKVWLNNQGYDHLYSSIAGLIDSDLELIQQLTLKKITKEDKEKLSWQKDSVEVNSIQLMNNNSLCSLDLVKQILLKKYKEEINSQSPWFQGTDTILQYHSNRVEGYNHAQALSKMQRISSPEAKFTANPTQKTWSLLHPELASWLTVPVIGFFVSWYALGQINRQIRKNKEQDPILNGQTKLTPRSESSDSSNPIHKEPISSFSSMLHALGGPGHDLTQVNDWATTSSNIKTKEVIQDKVTEEINQNNVTIIPK